MQRLLRKLEDYSVMGIPEILVIDPQDATITDIKNASSCVATLLPTMPGLSSFPWIRSSTSWISYRLRINVSGVPSSGFTKIMSFGSRLGVSMARKTTGPSIILGKA
jgi:hypothetical protein